MGEHRPGAAEETWRVFVGELEEKARGCRAAEPGASALAKAATLIATDVMRRLGWTVSQTRARADAEAIRTMSWCCGHAHGARSGQRNIPLAWRGSSQKQNELNTTAI